MKLRVLSAEDVRQSLHMGKTIESMKSAFIQLSRSDVVMPVRASVEVEKHNGVTLFMPAYLSAHDEMAIKMVSVFKENPTQGLPLIHAMVVVIDPTTGVPRAMMDGSYLTAFRTGAASGAATDLLAREEASSVAIFGAGVQGRTQLEAVCAARDIREAWIFDTGQDKAHRFASETGKGLSLEIQVAEDANEACQNADIICTATTSSIPVFRDVDIRRGTHINAVGAYTPEMREIPTETVTRSKVVIDHLEASMAEAGDLLIPMKEGVFKKEDLYAELGEIAAGIKPGRESWEEITLFKSVGVAVQDVATASLVLEVAEDQSLGVEIIL